MIRTWPGQTDVEFAAEVRRHNSLTQEEMRREHEEVYGNLHERIEKERLARIREKEEEQRKFDERIKYSDHPNTMDNGTATFFWIVAMIVGTLFNDRVYVYIGATAWWLCHIFRHEIRQWNKRREG